MQEEILKIIRNYSWLPVRDDGFHTDSDDDSPLADVDSDGGSESPQDRGDLWGQPKKLEPVLSARLRPLANKILSETLHELQLEVQWLG